MTMAKYRKRPELYTCVIPGVGVIPDGKILEGEEYAQYCPGLLEKVEEPSKPKPAPAPATVPDIPVEKVEKAEEPKEVSKEVETEEEKKPRRKKRGKK
jgi:hypothetical protein